MPGLIKTGGIKCAHLLLDALVLPRKAEGDRPVRRLPGVRRRFGLHHRSGGSRSLRLIFRYRHRLGCGRIHDEESKIKGEIEKWTGVVINHVILRRLRKTGYKLLAASAGASACAAAAAETGACALGCGGALAQCWGFCFCQRVLILSTGFVS